MHCVGDVHVTRRAVKVGVEKWDSRVPAIVFARESAARVVSGRHGQ